MPTTQPPTSDSDPWKPTGRVAAHRREPGRGALTPEQLALADDLHVRALALRAASAERDGAYRERAHLVAWLAALYPSVITLAPDVDEPGWKLVFIDSPTGQLSWHISPRDDELFEHVERVTCDDPRARWDGHTTEQKYARIRELAAAGGGGCSPAGEVTEPNNPAEPDNPAAWALARHIADYPMSTVQAAFRYLNAPIRFELHEAGLPSSYWARHAQSGINTPGCDCGHEGMGEAWHGDGCAWRATARGGVAFGATAPPADPRDAEVAGLRAQVAAARAFAVEMRGYCSPHGISALYADRLDERLDGAAARLVVQSDADGSGR